MGARIRLDQGLEKTLDVAEGYLGLKKIRESTWPRHEVDLIAWCSERGFSLDYAAGGLPGLRLVAASTARKGWLEQRFGLEEFGDE